MVCGTFALVGFFIKVKATRFPSLFSLCRMAFVKIRQSPGEQLRFQNSFLMQPDDGGGRRRIVRGGGVPSLSPMHREAALADAAHFHERASTPLHFPLDKSALPHVFTPHCS